VDALERSLVSCFTAWCPDCMAPYMLAADADQFPSLEAHHVHKIALLRSLREFHLAPEGAA
jgi:hypothetical protein